MSEMGPYRTVRTPGLGLTTLVERVGRRPRHDGRSCKSFSVLFKCAEERTGARERNGFRFSSEQTLLVDRSRTSAAVHHLHPNSLTLVVILEKN
jgi:hypothetical protein